MSLEFDIFHKHANFTIVKLEFMSNGIFRMQETKTNYNAVSNEMLE